MIIHSPETTMPAPYDVYVRQRAEAIAKVLAPVVGKTNTQLCPRAILPHEQVFADDPAAIIYGCMIESEEKGYKTALYRKPTTEGMAAFSTRAALTYADQQLRSGNRVRLKDPRESDGAGQHVASSLEEVAAVCENFSALDHVGLVLMPHMARVKDRYVVGKINLGSLWRYILLFWPRVRNSL